MRYLSSISLALLVHVLLSIVVLMALACTAKPVEMWEYGKSVDPMTDTVMQIAMADAVSGEGKYGDPIDLAVSCISSTAIVAIGWGSFIGMDPTFKHKQEVTLRWDSTDAISSAWELGSDRDTVDNTMLFDSESESFVKDMLRHDQLIARVTPYSGSSLTATFDLTGLEEAIKPLYEGSPGLRLSN